MGTLSNEKEKERRSGGEGSVNEGSVFRFRRRRRHLGRAEKASIERMEGQAKNRDKHRGNETRFSAAWGQ